MQTSQAWLKMLKSDRSQQCQHFSTSIYIEKAHLTEEHYYNKIPPYVGYKNLNCYQLSNLVSIRLININ